MSEIVIRVFEIENPHADELSNLPDPFVAEFNRINSMVDCYGGCWNCGEAVGWVLHDDDDSMRRGVIWHPVWLATEAMVLTLDGLKGDDGPVAALCESCAPSVPSFQFNARSGGAR